VKDERQVEIEGRSLALSNLDKVLYPAAGFTKGQVIEYYRRIAPVLLPHLRDRPLTLKRYPNGVDAKFFYEKRCPSHRPDWVATTPVWSSRHAGDIQFCLAQDLPSLVWAANLANLELHTSLSRADAMDRPTTLAFDLDPGPPASVLQCAEVAFDLRDLLAAQGLEAYVKTSGSKGLQLYVPLNVPTTYEETKPFAHAVARVLERRRPELVVSSMKRSLRPGKVLIDWSQNDEHKTTVCVYSLRARAEPTVSTPVSFDELERAHEAGDEAALRFTWEQALERVERLGDLFAPVLERRQRLPQLAPAADGGGPASVP
jgi:bifunctional non-homologous end joining protein LigD